jgi:MarR family transcriptional regulator, 2-MHQ and catechol-resistance regulon repressor
MSAPPAPTSADSRVLASHAEALHDAVSELVRVYQFRDRDQICCHDISVTQCYALEAVLQHGPLRLGALADRLYLDKSTASRVVATLVRKGYLSRKPDAHDRRATAISITRSGRQLHERITTDLIAQQEALLTDLDPAVRQGVVEVIGRLAKAATSRFVAGVGVGGPACCAPRMRMRPSAPIVSPLSRGGEPHLD